MISKYQGLFEEQKHEFIKLLNDDNLSMVDLMQVIKPKYINKNIILNDINVNLKNAETKEEKQELGRLKKTIIDELNDLFVKKKVEIEERDFLKSLEASAVDITKNSDIPSQGSIHPLTYTANLAIRIFQSYGFSLRFGPEVESSFYNFTVLNMDADHPARQMHDTFYLNSSCDKGEQRVLRTHTTAVDIKTLIDIGSPLKVISFGKTFRKDQDRTHTPMFHQLEILHVDKGLNLSNLKDLILRFLSEFFNSDKVQIRLRSSFFPFTEPSVEVDVKYRLDDEGRVVLDEKADKYMEILGCGVLHPNVTNAAKVPSGYTAIAAGIGVERLAMLKYGIEDLREFFKSNVSWLDKNSFAPNLY